MVVRCLIPDADAVFADTWPRSILGETTSLLILELSLCWQAKVFIVTAKDHSISEIRLRSETDTLENADFVLLYNGINHYNACG